MEASRSYIRLGVIGGLMTLRFMHEVYDEDPWIRAVERRSFAVAAAMMMMLP